MSSFRHLTDAHLHNPVRFQALDLLSLYTYFPRSAGNNTGDGHQRCTFPGTVGADQGDNLTLGHLQADIFKSQDVAVAGLNIPEFQHPGSPR